MAGRKRTAGRLCCLAVALKRRSALTSGAKTVVQLYSANGLYIRIRGLNIPMKIPGNACCDRAFSCSSGLHKTIASKYVNLKITCKLGLYVPCRTEMTSLLTSMRLAQSMATAAYWNGKRQHLAIQKNPMAYWLLILS